MPLLCITEISNHSGCKTVTICYVPVKDAVMQRFLSIFHVLAFSVLFPFLPAWACTDFVVKATDGTVVAARSMEWGADLGSRLAAHAHGEQRVSRTPKGKPGLQWISKYGFVGTDVSGLDAIVDGMNEKGLSFGELWLPNYTQYPQASTSTDSAIIDVTDLGAWILGNFASVVEAKEALKNVIVSGTPVPSFGGLPTVHVALHDAHGNNLVVEWVDGKQLIYDNPNGVLTNAPPFPWQTINLKNYIQVRAKNPQPIQVQGTILGPPGQGGGFLGIPGDWTPPSRFVRTTAMLQFAEAATNTESGIILAQHILNAVDIPRGDVRETIDEREFTDYTQWVLIKDLTNKAIYFRSYGNLTLRKLDLKNVDFNQQQRIERIPISGGKSYQEVTLPR